MYHEEVIRTLVMTCGNGRAMRTGSTLGTCQSRDSIVQVLDQAGTNVHNRDKLQNNADKENKRHRYLSYPTQSKSTGFLFYTFPCFHNSPIRGQKDALAWRAKTLHLSTSLSTENLPQFIHFERNSSLWLADELNLAQDRFTLPVLEAQP